MTLKNIQKEKAIFMFSQDLMITFSEPTVRPLSLRAYMMQNAVIWREI